MHEYMIGGEKYQVAPAAIQISSSTQPKTLEDLNIFHKDAMYEVISGARQAYMIKQLAGELRSRVSNSADVKHLANLISDSSRELERNWRMAACMSNAPVSTGYPYLPIMPSGAPAIPANPSSTPPTAAVGGKQTIGSESTASLPTSAVKSSFSGITLSLGSFSYMNEHWLYRMSKFI